MKKAPLFSRGAFYYFANFDNIFAIFENPLKYDVFFVRIKSALHRFKQV